jgi:hypothetical protein
MAPLNLRAGSLVYYFCNPMGESLYEQGQYGILGDIFSLRIF